MMKCKCPSTKKVISKRELKLKHNNLIHDYFSFIGLGIRIIMIMTEPIIYQSL